MKRLFAVYAGLSACMLALCLLDFERLSLYAAVWELMTIGLWALLLALVLKTFEGVKRFLRQREEVEQLRRERLRRQLRGKTEGEEEGM